MFKNAFFYLILGMFTGIIEAFGKVKSVRQEAGNKHFTIESPISNQLRVDQSVSHNGVCLTVIRVDSDSHTVTAIDETLRKSNLGKLKQGDAINLERCMVANGRFDGHIVQGHVDQTGMVTSVKEANGSWLIDFEYDPSFGNVTVEKGSVCVNGVSLTVVNSKDNSFSVCIIPYTFEHTNFKTITPGAIVNIEFDIVGKYIAKMLPKA